MAFAKLLTSQRQGYPIALRCILPWYSWHLSCHQLSFDTKITPVQPHWEGMNAFLLQLMMERLLLLYLASKTKSSCVSEAGSLWLEVSLILDPSILQQWHRNQSTFYVLWATWHLSCHQLSFDTKITPVHPHWEGMNAFLWQLMMERLHLMAFVLSRALRQAQNGFCATFFGGDELPVLFSNL